MLKLNCDIGESFGIWKMAEDKEIMPFIDMANIACGFHASDPLNMNKTIKLAKKHKVVIGAHPSYQDLVGFGRRTIPYSTKELKALILYQVGALRAIANANGVDISYIKPHGALYNDMMKNIDIFSAINKTIYSYDKNLSLMVLSTLKNSELEKISNIPLIFEAFGDRAYNNNGFLVSRKKEGSVIKDKKKVIKRVRDILKKGVITSIDNKELKLKVDSLCVHGDNKEALNLVKAIKEELNEI